MSVFENEYDLPGVYMNILPDFSYGYDTSLFGSTDPVLIIGTAFNGPNSGQPVEIYSKEHASYVFGKVYDNEKQQESNLVAGIHDAWDRGCRTIYACRVGGIDIYKDFKFCVDIPYRFRVMSMFPSNIEKDCYIRYEVGNSGEHIIYIYKPAERATVLQRRQGLVEGEATVLKTTIALTEDYGIYADTPLVDVINLINGHIDNNVIKLGIVDEQGNDVTNTVAVRGIGLGAIYQGVYFIGRKQNIDCNQETELDFKLLITATGEEVDVSEKPYRQFKGNYYRTLKLNTDVLMPYPIYGNNKSLQNILKNTGISVNVKAGRHWEWLEKYQASQLAFPFDDKDYEEVDLAGFDLYQRLGMGFAITAKAEPRKDTDGNLTTPRVKETSVTDKQHVIPIIDGYYSIIQDAPMKYRVLTCTTAEASTKGKIPRARDFMQASPNPAEEEFIDLITITPNVKEDDFTDARQYVVQFKNVPETAIAKMSEVCSDYVLDVVSILPTVEPGTSSIPFNLSNHSIPQGTFFLMENDQSTDENPCYYLVRTNELDPYSSNGAYTIFNAGEYLEGKFIIGVNQENKYHVYRGELTVVDSFGNKEVFFKPVPVLSEYFTSMNPETRVREESKYLLGSHLDNVFVFAINKRAGSSGYDEVEFNGDLNGMLTADQSVPVVYAEDMFFQPNDVVVSSSAFYDTTLEEFVDLMNNHEVFGKIFTLSLTDEGIDFKDETVLSAIEARSRNVGITAFDDADIATMIADAKNPDTEFALTDPVIFEQDRHIAYNYDLYIPYKTTDNFARQFAQHCTYTELRTAPTWGFIGTNRVSSVDLLGVAKSVNDLLVRDFSLYAKNNVGRNMMDRENLPYPIGRNLSIIFAQYETFIETENYNYVSNGAAGYAGMVSRLPLDQSSTNQPIDIEKISFYLARHQHAALNAKGIVTLKRSFTRGTVVVDGTTMAPAESVFRRLSASRIVGAIEELIRAVAEPYIGKQNYIANRNSLHTAIKAQLDELLGTLLEDYQFQLIVDSRAERYNYIDIEYEIVPIYEIRQIRNRISVKERLTV